MNNRIRIKDNKDTRKRGLALRSGTILERVGNEDDELLLVAVDNCASTLVSGAREYTARRLEILGEHNIERFEN